MPRSVCSSAKFGETEILAGGTDLVTCLKQNLVAPKRLVSLKGIPSLKGIDIAGDKATIGAMTSLVDVLENTRIRKEFPAITQAIEAIGSPQILSMGTIAGDLCQRPRCWYYRQGFGLLGQEDGKSLIPNGDNRYHAIFGNDGPAYFVNPSAIAPPLIALGATLEIAGPKSKNRASSRGRLLPHAGQADERENVLAANEVITRIVIPVRGMSNATYEIRQRQGLDWPLVSASVAFGGKDDKAGNRAGPRRPDSVARAGSCGAAWRKYPSIEAAAGRAGEAAIKGAKPLSKNAYKVQLVQTAVKRAILAGCQAGRT